ncbi:DUF2125 domain-containing protein [Humitalea sp. 24SJ18S-53]|uniref:DUF2125 domain-containing protein n=1 Tax=Humitalea sp. 24SJ18S-53 TaxID=3422307 RepID=UPI003D67DECD
MPLRFLSRRRWWLLLLILLPLLVAGGHTLLWRWMGAQIEQSFAAWADARRAQGWTIAHGPPEHGGWPFAATLRLPEIRFVGAAGTVPGGLEWTAETLTLRVALPNIGELEVEPEGFQRLRLGDAEAPFIADRMLAVFALEPGVPPRDGRFAADRLRVGMAGGALELRAATGRFESRMSATEAEPALLIALEARDILLPMPGPLGRAVTLLQTEVAMTGPIPGGRQPTRRAATWRDAGGTFDLRSLTLQWGDVTLEGAATLALDDQLQPMGAGTLRLTGASEGLAALAEAGAVGARAAFTAQAMVAFMGRPGPEGGPPQIDVPLTLENRTVAIARIPLARMPALVWPGEGAAP